MILPPTLNALEIRRRLGRTDWSPPQAMGPDGWSYVHLRGNGSVIVTAFDDGGIEYIHASMTRSGYPPTYEDLTLLHGAIFPGYAIQVFAPPTAHINIHETCLHLWGRLDGKIMHPDFGRHGTI